MLYLKTAAYDIKGAYMMISKLYPLIANGIENFQLDETTC